MSSTDQSAPLRRVVLWGGLAAGLGALAVALVMAPRWVRQGIPPPPPVIAELPPFELLNRDGRAVSLQDLAGDPWVADFIFTRCALSCPRMTRQMVRLGTMMPRRDLHRVSISVEPEHDTPEVLTRYARDHGIQDERWLFLTGEREAILELARDGFLLGVDDSPPPGVASELEPILHSTRFVLVDGEARIRGYYDASRGAELERLVGDLRALLAAG